MALNWAQMPLTWEEALAEREAKGYARGYARGRMKAAREVIGLMLKHRFRPDASELAEIGAKLQTINDLKRLHEVMELVAKANRFEDVDLG